MSKEKVIAQALALPPRDRELLAEQLWLSLDDATREEVHEAWAAEIARRLKQLDGGEVKSISAEAAARQARKLVQRKRRA